VAARHTKRSREWVEQSITYVGFDARLRFQEAIEALGLNTKVKMASRNANLTARGLPTPNLFTGGHNFHGKLEWNSRKGLEKSTETLVNLFQIFAEKTQ
jgi:tripeptide aminopeptidase